MTGVVEQDLRPEHIGRDELGRPEDRPVDVRLGGEVDDRLTARGGFCDRVGIGDVALVELVLDAFEIRPIARVRQLVENDDVVPAGHEAPHEVRADEAGAAGDENAHRRSLRGDRGQTLAQTVTPVWAAQVRLARIAAPSTRVAAPWRRTRRSLIRRTRQSSSGLREDRLRELGPGAVARRQRRGRRRTEAPITASVAAAR